jgi:hypothetical protein
MVHELLQGFTFLWLHHTYMDSISVQAAAATLHSMASHLTELTVPDAGYEVVAALQQASPALAQSLSSLSFDFHIFNPQRDFRIAAQALRGLAARLQRIGLGFIAQPTKSYSTAEVKAADAVFAELIHSLPSCQRLDLCLGNCISPPTGRWALLHHAPHLRSVMLANDHKYGQVSLHVRTDTK